MNNTEEQFFVFRTLEISSMTPRIDSKPFSRESSHFLPFGDSWRMAFNNTKNGASSARAPFLNAPSNFLVL